jgi:hypothetical protein
MRLTFDETGGCCMVCKRYREEGRRGRRQIIDEFSRRLSAARGELKTPPWKTPDDMPGRIESLPGNIVRQVRKDFETGRDEHVLFHLASYGIEAYEDFANSVRKAILNEAAGNVSYVVQSVTCAKLVAKLRQQPGKLSKQEILNYSVICFDGLKVAYNDHDIDIYFNRYTSDTERYIHLAMLRRLFAQTFPPESMEERMNKLSSWQLSALEEAAKVFGVDLIGFHPDRAFDRT